MRLVLVLLACSSILFSIATARAPIQTKAISEDSSSEEDERTIGIDLEADEPLEDNKHTRFFNALTENEREWIIRLTLRHESDLLNSAEIAKNGGGVGNNIRGVKPSDPVGLIPDGVYDKMLNGEVSGKFHKKFIGWLKKDLGYTDENIRLFSFDEPRFCNEAQACLNITNIGGLCCPFG